MKLDFGNDRSIYLQIAESMEDDILSGAIGEEEQLPSINQMAVIFKINPATAGKGIALLVEQGIAYKKRGIGMFVSAGARQTIREKRKTTFYETYVAALLREAGRLGIGREELIHMIQKGENANGADPA